MKIVITTLFLIISTILFSQNVKVIYKIGVYGFGEKGEYEKQEISNIFSKNGKNMVTFVQLKNSWIFDEETKKNNKKITDTITKKTKFINDKKLLNLTRNLEINKENFDFKTIQGNLKTSITKKQIVEITKKYDCFYEIGDEETGKIDEFGRKKIRNLIKKKFLEEYVNYIKPKSDTLDTIVFVDYWNFLIIENGSKKYKMNFSNDLGQPIESENKTFINLDINLSLLKILPRKSILRNKINFESLYEDYIIWFLKTDK